MFMFQRGTFIVDQEEYYIEPMDDGQMTAERKRRGRDRHDKDSDENVEDADIPQNMTHVVMLMDEEEDMESVSYESS